MMVVGSVTVLLAELPSLPPVIAAALITSGGAVDGHIDRERDRRIAGAGASGSLRVQVPVFVEMRAGPA